MCDQGCGPGKYSPNGCFGENCCLECVSSALGQHSVGCGDPADLPPTDPDTVAHTKNTECAACLKIPIQNLTQRRPVMATCIEWTIVTVVIHSAKLALALRIRLAPSPANLFRWLAKRGPIIWPTVVDDRKPSAADEDAITAEQCANAAAFQCVPCASKRRVSYTTNYAGTYFGRSNQPAWTTNGLTGQTYCRSYWDLWAYQTYKDIVAFDEDNGKPTGGGGT